MARRFQALLAASALAAAAVQLGAAEPIPGRAHAFCYEFPASPDRCGPAGNCFPSCTFPERLPWFVDPNATNVTDSHPHRNPSSGNVPGYPEQDVQGFELIGRFEGASRVLQVVSFTSRNAMRAEFESGPPH